MTTKEKLAVINRKIYIVEAGWQCWDIYGKGAEYIRNGWRTCAFVTAESSHATPFSVESTYRYQDKRRHFFFEQLPTNVQSTILHEFRLTHFVD